MTTETLIVDVAWSKPTAAAVKAAGYKGVIGYISHDSGKDLGAKQAKAYVKAGLAVALVFETTATEAEHNAATGAADCRYAEKRAKAMGYPAAAPIFYAVDEDVPAAKVDDYFDGVASAATYAAGPYGSRKVCLGLRARHKSFVEWQTVAWSLGKVDAEASLYQRNKKTLPTIAGLKSDAYDEDVVMKTITLWGATLAPPAAPVKPVKPVKPKRHPIIKAHLTVAALLTTKAKAFAGALAAAVVAYVGKALTGGPALSLHGLELAITVAVSTFCTVHQTSNAKKVPAAKK